MAISNKESESVHFTRLWLLYDQPAPTPTPGKKHLRLPTTGNIFRLQGKKRLWLRQKHSDSGAQTPTPQQPCLPPAFISLLLCPLYSTCACLFVCVYVSVCWVINRPNWIYHEKLQICCRKTMLFSVRVRVRARNRSREYGI